MRYPKKLRKWLTIGIGVKRWLIAFTLGNGFVALGMALGLIKWLGIEPFHIQPITWFSVISFILLGGSLASLALLKLSYNLLAPYRRHTKGSVVDVVVNHSKRQKGIKLVAIGGGTGLPAVLRGMKLHTSNITAIVTVADDGGSSGKLRRDMGVLPPGDLRNNIAALADDESLLTRLFQYRFSQGDLNGHAFGNLFIAALANVVSDGEHDGNSLAEALVEVERVLNIQGRVLPATLDDVTLTAQIKLTNSNRLIKVRGESQIERVDGHIEQVHLEPLEAEAYHESVRAILEADVIVIGPGSLYTSILPNLLVKGIGDALRQTSAYKIYVCNVATQPVETEDYTVADHIIALERHIGRGVFQAVIANDTYPIENAGKHTRYVLQAPRDHEVWQRYEICETDLTDSERPWRHDPQKLAPVLLSLYHKHASGNGYFLKIANQPYTT